MCLVGGFVDFEAFEIVDHMSSTGSKQCGEARTGSQSLNVSSPEMVLRGCQGNLQVRDGSSVSLELVVFSEILQGVHNGAV